MFTNIKGSVTHKPSIVNDMFRIITENKSRHKELSEKYKLSLFLHTLTALLSSRQKNQHINDSPNKTHRVTKPMAIELIITKRGES